MWSNNNNLCFEIIDNSILCVFWLIYRFDIFTSAAAAVVRKSLRFFSTFSNNFHFAAGHIFCSSVVHFNSSSTFFSENTWTNKKNIFSFLCEIFTFVQENWFCSSSSRVWTREGRRRYLLLMLLLLLLLLLLANHVIVSRSK